MNNKYIVFEGIDGSGKSTQLDTAAKVWGSKHSVVTTREPGSGMNRFSVRDFLLSNQKINPKALELLLWADRAEHQEHIRESILAGSWVFSDRSYISGLAYGLACNHDLKQLAQIAYYTIDIYPAHVILFDLSAKEAQRRVTTSTREEIKGSEFMEGVRQNFRFILEEDHYFPKIPYTVINATQSEADVAKEVHSVLKDLE